MNQSKARPDRVVAAENEAVARALQHRLHTATVGLDARSLRVPQLAAVHRAPKVRVELEIRDAPLVAHGAEDALQVLLHFGIGAIERVPRTAPPPLERDLVRGKRLAIFALHEPVGMLLKHVRTGLGDERRHPDGRLETLLADVLQHLLYAAAERAAGL